jgi:hypothetical protein
VAYYNTDQPTVTVSIRLTGSAGGWSDRIDMIKDVTLTKGKITRLTIAFDENSDGVDIELETDTGMDESNDDVTVQ